jgi:hypothetical protein
MTGPLVNSHHGFLRWATGEAKDLPRVWIEPGPLEMDILVTLDVEVALVGLCELLLGDPEEAGMDIHEFRHALPPMFGPALADRG